MVVYSEQNSDDNKMSTLDGNLEIGKESREDKLKIIILFQFLKSFDGARVIWNEEI